MVTVSAAIAVLVAVKHWSGLITWIFPALTAIYGFFTFLRATFEVWSDERSLREQENKRIRDGFSVKSAGFREFDFRDLHEADFQQFSMLEFIKASRRIIYTAVIELENFGDSSRASNWHFRSKVGDDVLDLEPLEMGWAAPVWLNISENVILQSDLERFYYSKGYLYTVVLYLDAKTRLQPDVIECISFSFSDKNGRITNWSMLRNRP